MTWGKCGYVTQHLRHVVSTVSILLRHCGLATIGAARPDVREPRDGSFSAPAVALVAANGASAGARSVDAICPDDTTRDGATPSGGGLITLRQECRWHRSRRLHPQRLTPRPAIAFVKAYGATNSVNLNAETPARRRGSRCCPTIATFPGRGLSPAVWHAVCEHAGILRYAGHGTAARIWNELV